MKSVKKNYLYNTAFQVLTLLVPFITTPYVSRVLGADKIGEYSYAAAIVSLFTLFAAFGTDTYGQRTVAYHRENKAELSKVFWNTFIFRLILCIAFGSLYFAYIFIVEKPNTINLILSINLVNVAVDISWLFQGLEEFKSVVFRNLLIRLICLAGIFTLVKTEKDLWIYVSILVFSVVLGSLSMWCLLPRFVSFTTIVKPFEPFKESLLIFLPSIAIQVYTVLDKAMIGWITTSSYENGCYEQSERIVRLALTVVTSVGIVVAPRVANLFAKNDIDGAKSYVYKAINVVWAIAIPIMLGLNVVSSIFIPLFLGEGFDLAVDLLEIFSFLVPVVSFAHIIGVSYLIPTRQQNVYTAAVTCAACVNYILNIIFISKIGALGAAIASVIAEGVGTGIQLCYCIVKKQLSAKLILNKGWKYIISGLLMYFVLCGLKTIYPPNVLGLGLMVCSGIIVYFTILFILRDELVRYYLKLILKNVRRTLK